MMISPNGYAQMYADKKYAELLKERDELLDSVRSFEQGEVPEIEDAIMPSPEVRYQCNLLYLAEICRMISEAYRREYVWRNEQ